MAVWRGLQCPLRGGGLSHTEGASGACIHCNVPLTSTAPAAPPASAMDDRLGRQLDYENAQCPARGAALSHYLPDRVAGPCLHCHRDVVHRLDHERMMTKVASQPVYDGMLRLHGTSSMMAYRAHRPVLSSKHNAAARLMMRAIRAERDDPMPDFLPG